MRFAAFLGLGLASLALNPAIAAAASVMTAQQAQPDTAPVERKQRRQSHRPTASPSFTRSRWPATKPKKHPNRLRFRLKAKNRRRRARMAA